MAHYPELKSFCDRVSNGLTDGVWTSVVGYLTDVWINDYAARCTSRDIVETTTSGFSYLFDIASGRLLAAYGVSHGRHGGKRDASRMAGHPLSDGPRYHRGHAIPHTLGGPTDINLVPQLGAINIGPFRRLEKLAVATPGSFYFTYWSYPGGDSQRPSGVDQGLLIPGQSPQITPHVNE
jgi:hypothetical protein